ncbi:thiamine phosphate synthase [Microbulbifer hydrolyticus]|uniref:Thiamine-phosphate synthase n=1 Tax=Microbulbifer hydrolyticus TaxID=48074 RepID=A0A6P1TBJ8_9GAMM|nr:thiamine phosphate synthase [Microbulbifer hydrolyticus]MBB5213147.1 hydroxymethylpyrimidine kinase/phosphomethylpyrimidine kinase/thiamine-phosphate diphosphorylase [Microbulbifer hydrolyticus]QHQ38649.1 thiamine phosphate synthase [Microbulbifer hydrolyticus]
MSSIAPPRPIVWTIAGSDSGGGAGIQADLLTLHDFDVHGCSVITANTAQNTLGVPAINAVSDAVLQSQLDALIADLKPAAIKIGLLANAGQVKLVAKFLRGVRAQGDAIPVVYDPVAVATSGAHLTEDSTGAAVLNELLPLCDLITPNGQELAWLAQTDADTAEAILAAARKVRGDLPSALLVTGGHFEIEPSITADLLCRGHDDTLAEDWLIGEKIETENTHGTGCTLSSAIAALLAKGYPLKDACVVANAYVRHGLRTGISDHIGAGPGPVGHCGWPGQLRDFPQILVKGSERAKCYGCYSPQQAANFAAEFTHPDSNRLGLYPVVDSVEWIEKLARAGVRTLQLRIKHPGEDLHQQIERAVAIGRDYDLRLFINDHWALAIECGAYGVHLGQEDLQSADLKAIQAAGLKLGISTHGFFELLYAHQFRPSYLAIGAIYATSTKDMSGQLQGPEKLARMVALLPDYALVAIGGINSERAPAVVASGVGSIAVVTAITEAPDYRQSVAQLTTLLDAQ